MFFVFCLLLCFLSLSSGICTAGIISLRSVSVHIPIDDAVVKNGNLKIEINAAHPV
jgi:hypothetical protein